MKPYTLQEVIDKLPPFVKIIEEEYINTRTKCKFYDIEYDEYFYSTPAQVYSNQRGCETRYRKEQKLKWEGTRFYKISLEEFKEKLPNYIQIIEDTWKGFKYKSLFFDTEFQEYFETECSNIKRVNCRSRGSRNLREKLSLSEKKINDRLDTIYPIGSVRINYETYKNVDESAEFYVLKNDSIKTVRYIPAMAFQGFLSNNRAQHKIFRKTILDKFNNKCFISDSTEKLEVHHIFPKRLFPNLRFDENNGIPLTGPTHREFHKRYGRRASAENFLEFCKQKKIEEDKIAILSSSVNVLYAIINKKTTPQNTIPGTPASFSANR